MAELTRLGGRVTLVVCPECLADVSADAARCPRCGHDQPVTCPRCAEPCAPSSRFCPHCGTPLARDDQSSRNDDYARERRAERKLVTVVFADLVDSTGLGDSLDPELYHQAITALFRRVATSTPAFETQNGTK